MPMLVGLLPACSWFQGAGNNVEIDVTAVDQVQYSGAPEDPLRSACEKWTLTPAQVERFFAISQRYPESRYSEFYQLPCAISGALEEGGRTWAFEINGGGMAIWKAGDEVRNWGCSAKECRSLVLLPTDEMRGE